MSSIIYAVIALGFSAWSLSVAFFYYAYMVLKFVSPFPGAKKCVMRINV